MKGKAFSSILALCLLSSVIQQSATAQTGGSSASGWYKFSFEDGLTKYVEFDARTDEKGTTTGQMTLKDEAQISDPDVGCADDPRPDDSSSDIYIQAEFDRLTVEKNRAVMSGVVRDSNLKSYIGKWVQLVVEDSGDDIERHDRLTWGVCQPPAGGWIPTDAELKDDDGAWRTWWATDAELKDDVGVPSRNLISSEMKGCQNFPLSSNAFVAVKNWEGDIQVRP